MAEDPYRIAASLSAESRIIVVRDFLHSSPGDIFFTLPPGGASQILSKRVRNALSRAGYRGIDLLRATEPELRSLPYFGEVALAEVLSAFAHLRITPRIERRRQG